MRVLLSQSVKRVLAGDLIVVITDEAGRAVINERATDAHIEV